jgi:hypothetical protein
MKIYIFQLSPFPPYSVTCKQARCCNHSFERSPIIKLDQGNIYNPTKSHGRVKSHSKYNVYSVRREVVGCLYISSRSSLSLCVSRPDWVLSHARLLLFYAPVFMRNV